MPLGRRSRWISIAIAVLALVLGITLAVVRKKYNGPALARVVAHGINFGKFPIRGRVEIDSVEWDTVDIVRLGRLPVRIIGFRLFDPAGKKVLEVARARARLNAWHVLPGGSGDITASDLVLDDKAWCLIGQRHVHALGVRSIARAHPEVRHHADDLAPLCRLI